MYPQAKQSKKMIRIISIITLSFAGLRMLVALSNYLFSLLRSKRSVTAEPWLSVLIPARDEEMNIGNILDDLRRQEYNNLEIIVLDDSSSDSTAEVVREKMKKDLRLKLINNKKVPAGWSGKNYACHRLAQEATGKYLLFLDADISISDNIIGEMTAYMIMKKTALVSIFPKQLMQSFGERITVPIMNWILLCLLPLYLVQISKRPSLAAANGQFMLFDADIYKTLMPHSIIRSSLVEDIEIMRMLKRLKPVENKRRSLTNRYRSAVLTGDSRISCRMYNNYDEAIHGFSKNVLHFFGKSLVWTFIFLFLTGPAIIFPILHSLELFLAFILINIFTRLLVSLTSKQNIILNIILAPLHQLSLYIIVYKAVKVKFAGEYIWKERRIKL